MGAVVSIPVAEVCLDVAGLGGAGLVLFSDEAESTNVAEEADTHGKATKICSADSLTDL